MKEIKIVYKGNLFLIRALKPEDVKNNYIKELKKQKYILRKNFSIKDQKDYVRNLNKNKKQTILGIFNKNKLIATSGLQNLNKKIVNLGIFLFDKKFKGKGFGHFFINLSLTFIYIINKKTKFKCGIDNKNVVSVKSFQKAGFKKIGISREHKDSKIYFLAI